MTDALRRFRGASASPRSRAFVRASTLRLVLRLTLAALFIYAGTVKLRDPTSFAIEIDRYQLLPALTPYVAAALPLTEIALALVLLAPLALWHRAAALGCAVLVAVFTAAALAALARDLNIDCGCFGAGSGPITWLTIARDLALLAACAVCAAPAAQRVGG